MPRSKVMRVGEDMHEALWRGLEKFNADRVIPKFRKPIGMVDYTNMIAQSLDEGKISRMVVIAPEKRNTGSRRRVGIRFMPF